MGNKQQTAVDWLLIELQENFNQEVFCMYNANQYLFESIFQKAKAMEKEQIENAWDRGQYIGENFPQRVIEPEYENDSEQYYNETYGTK